MKAYLDEILHFAIPKFSMIIELFNKPLFGFFTISSTVVAVQVVSFWDSVDILKILFIADFATGMLASWLIWRKKHDRKDKWFFGKGEGFSSDKFKKMFIKLMVYLGTPIVINKFQNTFLLKNLKYSTISDAEIELTTFVVLLFCLNELYSIFNENLPKCGFNLWERIEKIIDFFKKIKSKINEAKEV